MPNPFSTAWTDIQDAARLLFAGFSDREKAQIHAAYPNGYVTDTTPAERWQTVQDLLHGDVDKKIKENADLQKYAPLYAGAFILLVVAILGR